MGNTAAVPDLVSEHELSEDATQSVPDLVDEHERQNSIPDLVSLHEAAQNSSTFRSPSSKPAAGSPRLKPNSEPAPKDSNAASTLPGAGPSLTLAEQKKAAAKNPEIAKYPQNQPPPDPGYIAKRKAWEAIAAEPGAPDFAFDPEQERRIKAQEDAEAGKHPATDIYVAPAVAPPTGHGRSRLWEGRPPAPLEKTEPVVGNILKGFQENINEPLAKSAATGAEVFKQQGDEILAATLTGGQHQYPERLPNGQIDYRPPPQTTEEHQARLQEQLSTLPPALVGGTRAVTGTLGSMAFDPRMWPFFFAGPEVSAGLRAAYGTGFTAQMGVGAVQQASELGKIMDRQDVPQEQKWELGANAVLSMLMAAHGGGHQISDSFLHDFNRLPATDQAQIRQRIRAKAPELAAQVDRLTSPHDAATQAMLDHQRATGDLGSPQAATQAMLEFENSTQQSALSSQPPNKTTQQPAIGHQPTVSSPTAPHGNNTLSSAQVEGMAKTIASRPEADRGALIDDLHWKLTQWIVANKGKVVVHGRIELAKTPEQAEVLAQRIINDAVSEFDKKSSQQSAVSTQPRQVSVQGRQEAKNEAGAQSPPAEPQQIGPMGRGMTTDSPAVRRVEQEAQVVPGQEPLVMVKKESPHDAQALSQPAQPVQPEAVARIGENDRQSGRQIVQPSNSELQNERLAGEAAPELATQLSEAASGVPGARLDRIRPQKNLERIEEKVKADDKPPRTIQDYLASQIAADTPQAKDLLIAELRKRFKVISVEDKFLEGRPELAGYPSANLQVQMSNGSTAEVQIVPREVQQVTDLSHRYYTDGRKAELEGNLAARDWNHARAAEINRRALETFKKRNGISADEPHSVPQGGVVEGLSHAPPGQIEEAASTGRPNQGGLGVYGSKTTPPQDFGTDKLGKESYPSQENIRLERLTNDDVQQGPLLHFDDDGPTGVDGVKSNYIPPEGGHPPRVVLSRGAMEVLTEAVGQWGQGALGLAPAAHDVRIWVRKIHGVAAGLMKQPRVYEALIALANNFDRAWASADNQGVTVIVEGAPEHALHEELFHGKQHELGGRQHLPAADIGRLAGHLVARRVRALMVDIGYPSDMPDSDLVAETAAKLATGDPLVEYISLKEARKWMADYISAIRDRHGATAIAQLRTALPDKMLEFYDECVRRADELQQAKRRTVALQEGNTASRGRFSKQPRPGTQREGDRRRARKDKGRAGQAGARGG
jgi:hypothetical protein